MDDLIDLQDHCQLISKFLYEFGYDSSSDWFDIASKIENTKYNSFKYDKYIGWCESADDYSEAKGVSNTELIEELSKFNFIWNGLESVISDLELEKCPFSKGKINALTYFIQKNCEKKISRVNYYNEIMYLLRLSLYDTDMIQNNKKNINKIFSLNHCNSIHGLGVSIIYKIRNEFAHGAFKFRMPFDWNKDPKTNEMKIEQLNEIQVLNLASRIILLTVQIVFIGVLESKSDDFLIENLEEDFEEELFLNPLDYLRVLHFYNFDTLRGTSNQLSMFY